MVTQLLLLDLRDATRPQPTARRAPAPRPVPTASLLPATRPAPATRPVPAGNLAPATRPAPADPAYWRLDDHTRELGLRGVEEARRALAAAVGRVGTAA